MNTHALWLSASVLALVCCGMAEAQTPPTKNNSTTVETVVVTAERRSENLMTTPISADVISGDDLQSKGVLTVDNLQFIAPSVTVDNFGQGIDFNIRGIGKGEHNTQTETGVITYRDGVATFPGYFTEEPYYDIASIEVLRGPQGTFVGQNATGGAVFVTSNDPEIGGDNDGYVQAQYGNYNDTQLQGAVNIPLSDTLAIRVAAFGEARGSFYSVTDSDPADNCTGHKYAGCKTGYNPGDQRWGAGRVSVLWKPTEALTVSFKTDADFLDSGAWDASPYQNNFKFLPYGSSTPNPNYSDLFHITANAPMRGLDRFTRSVLKVDYVFPDGITLRSVSGFQNGNTNYSTDLDATDTGNATFFARVDETLWSEELNLISPDTSRVTWILGAFAQANRYGWERPFQFVIGTPAGNPATEYKIEGSTPYASWAGFGQVGFKVTDDLQIQLGGRWSSNRVHNDVPILQYGTALLANQTAKSYSFDYKASINWTLNEDQFLYAFVATGYKPGGLNLPIGTVAPYNNPTPFGSERVMSYEAGWKAQWFGGHMRTQIDGFYNDYRHFIVNVAAPQTPFYGTEINDPHTTTIYGLEAETQAVFGKLSFSAGLGLLHSALGKFFAIDPRLASFITPSCDPQTGPVATACIDLSGHQQTYAPNFTFNLTAQYEFDLDDGDKLTPRISYANMAAQWATLFDQPQFGDRIGQRNLVGAQLEWRRDTYTVTLYSSNLLDQHYVGNMFSGLNFAGPPRQFGIRLMKTF
jgi:iron complex outermembrane recepter protein